MQMQRQKLLKEKKTNQGITLVALVVTIVTLLILAGITINLLMTDNGIFATAQKAKQAQEIGQLKDRMAIHILDWSAEKIFTPETTINKLWDRFVKDDIIDNAQEDVKPSEEKENVYEVMTKKGYLVEIIVHDNGSVEIGDIVKGDKLPPKVSEIKVTSKTTNSIEIQVKVSRLEEGKLTYLYKKDTEPEENYRELKKNTTDLTASFTGLEQNVVYNIKVIAKNKNGQVEKVISEITGELPRGTISQKGETSWSNGKASIELETTATGYTLQYQINSREGTWQKYTGAIGSLNHGDVVYARLYDGNNASDTAAVNIQDGTAPTVSVTKGSSTTNSITVNVTATDAQTGMPASPSYSYYIKKNSDANYPTTATHTGTESSYTFTGLTQTTAYDVKVETKDNANNLGAGYLGNVATGTIGGADNGLLTGNITASPATWSNQKASITLSTNTGLTIQWQIGYITEGKWTTGTSVTGLSHGSVVYARLTDGVNVGDYGSVNIADGIAPTVSVTKGNVTTNSITVSVTSSDGQSGMPSSPSYSYYIKKQTDASYPATASYTGTNTSYTFTGLTQTTAYDVKVETKDNANNLGAGYLSNVVTGTIGGASNGLLTGNIVASPATWSNQKASITLSTNTGLTIQWQIGNITEGRWTTASGAGANATITGLSHGSVIYARLTDGVNVGDYGSVNIQDGVAPTVTVTKGNVTTNSITVSVTSSDGQSGMPGSPTYAYYIKRTTDANYGGASYTGTSSSYTFGGLSQSTGYDITVHAMDNANNVGAGYLSNVVTGTIGGASNGLLTGNIVASPANWSGGRASITLSTNTGLSIQWQIGNITEGRWTTGTSVTGLSHGSVVYARLTDGVNVGDYGSVNIADGDIPQNAGISLSSTSTTAGTGINATVTHTDAKSGIAIGNCKWVYNTTGSAIGTNPTSYTGGTFSSNPQTISLNTSTAGTYYLHVLSTDVAGNKRETISSAVTVKQPINTDGSYVPSKGVNSPKLGPGMTPVRWNGSSWVEAKTNDEWYDYSSSAKQWANAETSDGSMWVWIPRYAYQIAGNYHINSKIAGTVNIKFLQGISDIAVDGTSNWTNSSGQGNWNVHPAFSYGSQISGIWVAKFEASHSDATLGDIGSSSAMKIQPTVRSWRTITINDIYNKCLSYNNTLNSHQMKNSEWGAVAYLAQSTYGKNSEVWINNSRVYMTGCVANSVNGVNNPATYSDYTSTPGVNASTTGNIYGIYDMSGGAYEYVAAYVNNGHANLNNYGESLVSGDAKTKDVYNSATSSGADTRSQDYETAKVKYGDAVYETSSASISSRDAWYGDSTNFPLTSSPFFNRGGYYDSTAFAGLFEFSGHNGYSYETFGFRPVLCVM